MPAVSGLVGSCGALWRLSRMLKDGVTFQERGSSRVEVPEAGRSWGCESRVVPGLEQNAHGGVVSQNNSERC